MTGEPGDRPEVYGPEVYGPEVYGAAAERTALAWQRTGLGIIVGSFLVFQTSLRLGAPEVGWVALVLGVAVAVFALAFSRQRYVNGDPADSWVLLLGVAGAVLTLAVLGGTVAILTLLT